MFNSTLVGCKPTLTYTELCTTLARAASIINFRPIGIRRLRKRFVPLTVNQLLLGQSTTTTRPTVQDQAQDSYMAVDQYQDELLRQCWNRWRIIALPHLIPYQ